MRFYIVIPAHNEAPFIGKTLQSIVEQSLLPERLVVVNDNSSDGTAAIVQAFCRKYDFIHLVDFDSTSEHLPGSKVVNAFYKGFETLDDRYGIICKFDADLIFPKNYIATLNTAFSKNPKLGMAGGFCHIEKNGKWELENLADKTHLRGALKAYRKACFEEIGGLKSAMGWDTVDELLASYRDWEIKTIEDLKVKHLRPTGKTYRKHTRYIQGKAFYRLRYGFSISFISSAKLAYLQKDLKILWEGPIGYCLGKKQKIGFLVSEEEGRWIRKYRWKMIGRKLFG